MRKNTENNRFVMANSYYCFMQVRYYYADRVLRA